MLERTSGPAGIALTRQAVPVLHRGKGEASGGTLAHASMTARGGYVLSAASQEPEVILIATGSEVSLALEAQVILESEGIATRVVSMPCVEWFDEQSPEYRESVLPATIRARVSVEAGISQSWHRFLGEHGQAISLEHFGASADYQTLYREFGITTEAVVSAAKRSLESLRKVV
jgi:transketolase